MRTATWFGLWAVAGVGTALGVLTMLTIGIFVLPAALVLDAVLAWRAPRWLAAPGIVTGLGAPLCYVGYLNRGGPGMVCTTITGGTQCTQETSPWPWLASGLLIVLTGVTLLLAAARRRPRAKTGR